MKNVSLLPSLFTTGNIFCGTYAITLILNGKTVSGVWYILFAVFFDFLDGQAARLKNIATRFGMEYDSLADLISFGAAPALAVYTLSLNAFGRVGYILFSIYIVCTALRLARFNAQKPQGQKTSFLGLPAPASSGFIAALIIFAYKYHFPAVNRMMPFITLILAALMVSSLRYPASGMLNLWKKKPFFNLAAVIICGAVFFLHLELSLFLCFLAYVLSGVIGREWPAVVSVKNRIFERNAHEVV